MMNWVRNHVPFCAAMISMVSGLIAMAFGSITGWFICFLFAAIIAGMFPSGKNIE